MIDNLNEVMPPEAGAASAPISDPRKFLIPIFAAVVGLGIAIVIGIFVGYFIYTSSAARPHASNVATDDNANVVPNDVTMATSSLGIRGEVSWQTPEIMADQGIWAPVDIIPGADESVDYKKVGTFVSGKYKGGDLLLVTTPCDGMCFYNPVFRLVKSGDSFVILKKYSDGLWNGDGFKKGKFTIDDNYTIPELEFPQVFVGPQPRMIFEFDQNIRDLFDGSKYKKVFTHAELGDVYMDANLVSVSADGSSNAGVTRNGFYIKALDGTVRSYALKPDFMTKEVPNISWNDDTTNGQEYVYTDATGCGSANYAAVVSSQDFDIAKNLIVTGHNNRGDNVYEIKDSNHPLLKYIYNNQYNVYQEGQSKIPYDQFVKQHPVFFWVDPFGRLIKFKNNAFVPQAECGKPVIYLYPEQPTDVTVRVAPAGGFTYTDPVYNEKTGWVVHSDTQSNLIEKATGKKYPYLFWEGRGGIYDQPKDGFVIKQSEVHSFLIEKLAKLGLNKKETADFMEFWEPRMQSSPYYFVSFLGTSAMNQLAPLDISPAPDTVIRILMDFSPLDQSITVKEPRLSAPARNGFTVIEWGGVIR